MKIRNSAKAIIIEDNYVLLTKNEDRDVTSICFREAVKSTVKHSNKRSSANVEKKLGRKLTYESYFTFVNTLVNIMNTRLSMGMCIKLSFILRARSLVME